MFVFSYHFNSVLQDVISIHPPPNPNPPPPQHQLLGCWVTAFPVFGVTVTRATGLHLDRLYVTHRTSTPKPHYVDFKDTGKQLFQAIGLRTVIFNLRVWSKTEILLFQQPHTWKLQTYDFRCHIIPFYCWKGQLVLRHLRPQFTHQ